MKMDLDGEFKLPPPLEGRAVLTCIRDWTLPQIMKGDRASLCAGFERFAREFDVFVRSGNYTAWTVDEQAASSARIEFMEDGGKALTYSSMKGRRVVDIAHVVLYEVAETDLFPPAERQDGKKQHQRAKIEGWLKSLGFGADKFGNRTRMLFSGDKIAELGEKLEALIPERFAATFRDELPKKQVAIVAPASLRGVTHYFPVRVPDARNRKGVLYNTEPLIHEDALVLYEHLKQGWSFKEPSDPLPDYYLARIKKIHEAAEEAKKKAEEEERKKAAEAAA